MANHLVIPDPALHGEFRVGFHDLVPGEVAFEFGKPGIARVALVNVADPQFVDLRKKRAIHFRSADDECGGVGGQQRGNIGHLVDDLHPGCRPGRILGQDDVVALGQRTPDRLIGFAAHDDGMTGGGAFEKRKVGRQVPGQSASGTNDPFRGEGHDSDEFAHGDD